jgi:hypothetical protein
MGGRHQSECPADIIGIRRQAGRRAVSGDDDFLSLGLAQEPWQAVADIGKGMLFHTGSPN